MQDDATTMEDSLAVSYKTEHTLTKWSNKHAAWYLHKEAENPCPHKNMQKNVYSNFIDNCQNLEAANMFFSRWMSKLWHIKTMLFGT